MPVDTWLVIKSENKNWIPNPEEKMPYSGIEPLSYGVNSLWFTLFVLWPGYPTFSSGLDTHILCSGWISWYVSVKGTQPLVCVARVFFLWNQKIKTEYLIQKKKWLIHGFSPDFNLSNTLGAFSEAITTFPSGSPEFNPGFQWDNVHVYGIENVLNFNTSYEIKFICLFFFRNIWINIKGRK
jgi:hypothetical protein